MTDTKHCLDLFSGLGGFSQAFEAADGWDVTTVDMNEEFAPDICADVSELRPDDLPDPDVILASPPCQTFSTAALHHYWDEAVLPGQVEVGKRVGLVYHTLWLVNELQPKWWFLENPRGMLRKVMPMAPAGTVTYCQYGFDHQKPTDLWGDHPESMTYKSCSPGDSCHLGNARVLNTFRDTTRQDTGVMGDTAAERAKIPRGVSEAILDAVENPIIQTTFDEARA